MKFESSAIGVGAVEYVRVVYVPGAYAFVYVFAVSLCKGENALALEREPGMPATVGLLGSARADSGDSAAEA